MFGTIASEAMVRAPAELERPAPVRSEIASPPSTKVVPVAVVILIAIACIREPLGFGTLLGYTLPVQDLWWHPWTIMVMPPGAFFMLAIVTWIARNASSRTAEKSSLW